MAAIWAWTTFGATGAPRTGVSMARDSKGAAEGVAGKLSLSGFVAAHNRNSPASTRRISANR